MVAPPTLDPAAACWPVWAWAGAICVGLTVAATRGGSQAVVRNSLEPLAVQGLPFGAPSAEWLMRVLHSPAPKIGFDLGFLPGRYWVPGWVA